MPAPVHDSTFVPRLEAIRRLLDLSYADLARAAGVHETTLHRWRSGRGHPSRVFVDRVGDLEAVAAAAERVLGAGSAGLRTWLTTPHLVLGGRTPHALLVEGQATFVKATLSLVGGGFPDDTPLRSGQSTRGSERQAGGARKSRQDAPGGVAIGNQSAPRSVRSR
ncbi:MAG TPA: helix-turn-helix transcriptional regulator [Gemmatimonadaceae bacterium]